MEHKGVWTVVLSAVSSDSLKSVTPYIPLNAQSTNFKGGLSYREVGLLGPTHSNSSKSWLCPNLASAMTFCLGREVVCGPVSAPPSRKFGLLFFHAIRSMNGRSLHAGKVADPLPLATGAARLVGKCTSIQTTHACSTIAREHQVYSPLHQKIWTNSTQPATAVPSIAQQSGLYWR